MWGWIFFGILLVLYFSSMKYTHRRNLNLSNYAIYLLLNDEIRRGHKEKFTDWIIQTEAIDSKSFALKSWHVIDRMSENLAESGSFLAAHAMIWDYKSKANNN